MNINKNKFFPIFVSILTFFTFSPFLPFAAGKVYIDINSPYLRKIPVAIGSDVDNRETYSKKMSEEVSSVLKEDMDYSGYFTVKNIFYREFLDFLG